MFKSLTPLTVPHVSPSPLRLAVSARIPWWFSFRPKIVAPRPRTRGGGWRWCTFVIEFLKNTSITGTAVERIPFSARGAYMYSPSPTHGRPVGSRTRVRTTDFCATPLYVPVASDRGLLNNILIFLRVPRIYNELKIFGKSEFYFKRVVHHFVVYSLRLYFYSAGTRMKK